MRRALDQAIVHLGLADEAVCLHTRLSSFGWLSGGPGELVDAFVGRTTLMVPTFTLDAACPRPADRHLEHNGEGDPDDPTLPAAEPRHGFDHGRRHIDRSMGLVPRDVLHRVDTLRGDHPLVSFAAIGPHADDLVAGQHPFDPAAPLEALVARRGWVLTAGCGLSSVALVHLVHHRLGARPLRRWARDDAGAVHECATFGCDAAFARLEALVAHLERTAAVGTSTWRLWPARELVDTLVEARRADPALLVCSPTCPRCRDTAAGGPLG